MLQRLIFLGLFGHLALYFAFFSCFHPKPVSFPSPSPASLPASSPSPSPSPASLPSPAPLCVVLLVRVYATDKAALLPHHVWEWIQFLRYAGASRFLVYDAYVSPSESLRGLLGGLPFVTYLDWSAHNPYTMDGTQVSAYQHAIDHFGDQCVWQTAIDIDEYPTSELDPDPGFLVRYLAQVPDSVTEISMQNYLLLGPMNRSEFHWLAERYQYLTKAPGNHLVKPVYRPLRVRASLHHNAIRQGSLREEQPGVLRLSHVWGARIDDFQDGVFSQHVRDITQFSTVLSDLVARIKRYSF